MLPLTGRSPPARSMDAEWSKTDDGRNLLLSAGHEEAESLEKVADIDLPGGFTNAGNLSGRQGGMRNVLFKMRGADP